MAAYASVISLKHTINALLNSSSPICPSPFTREILESARDQAASSQKVLERSNDRRRSRRSRERLDGLEGQIRDCANKLEDVLELHGLKLLENEKVLVREITSFAVAVKKMERGYNEELSREDDDEDADAVASFWSNSDFGVEMVGQSSLFNAIRRDLYLPMRPDDTLIVALTGERGSGGTTIAKTVFQGRTHERKQLLISAIAQLSNLGEGEFELLNWVEDDLVLSKHLWSILSGRRYLIVLDDVDDPDLVNYLQWSFPKQSNGSVIIITTNSEQVARGTWGIIDRLQSTIFHELMLITFHRLFYCNIPDCDKPQVEVAGLKIIDNCRCRFVSAVKTILFLSKSHNKLEIWNQIAADKEHAIFLVSDEISEVNEIKTELQHYNGAYGEVMLEWLAHSHRVEAVKDMMHPKRLFSRMQITSFFGMAGIGKTAFARKLFKDESLCKRFEHRVWITLGPKYRTEEILIDILAQIYPDIDKFLMKGDEEMVRDLCLQLSCHSCLIVLDDLYSKEPLLHLKYLFPDIKGTTLVTTRLAKVAKFEGDDTHIEMELLDKEESWSLLRKKVFGGGLCSSEIEKVGRKIAERCDGLPLLILTVAEQLLKAEIPPESVVEYWDDVASDKEKSVFENAHQQISEGLLPSYQNLLQHLKPCFLYIGVFREKYEIPASNLTNLLIAEGFLEPNRSQMAEEDFVAECLSELVDNNLVMVKRKVSDFQIKTCRLHSVFWHLSKDQAKKNKFFHAMNRYDECSVESMECQRRLCIRNNILLGMKDVQSSMASNTSAVHSLLCVGPLQQFPVPLIFDMRLLRVMNAITVRLYNFPVEVASLLHLRYLGITCNGNLPTSISNLQKLQYLIVKRYMNARSSQNSSLLPVEIWDLEELKHLQIMGGCLPNHKSGSTGLLKLSTLLDVSAESCREEVLKWIPNLKRLGIRIELKPNDDGKSFIYLNNIHHLLCLESLKCAVVNPRIGSDFVTPPAPVSMFPRSLKMLSLSGLGYSWEHMSIITILENLEVLKLKCYAFQGPTWEMEDTAQFEKLKFLLIQDSDIVQWRLKKQITNMADRWVLCINPERLCIKHCYKLKELPTSNNVYCLNKIETVDCNPWTGTWAEETGKILQRCKVNVHRSWIANTHQE